MLSQRMLMISGSQTSGMRAKAKHLQQLGIDVINFAAGELDLSASVFIKNAAKQSIDLEKSQYTDTLGLPSLKSYIAENVSARLGIIYTSAEVGITAGAKQALYNAMMAIINPGDEIIIPTPCWVTFPTQIKLAGGIPIMLDTEVDNYQLNLKKVKALITPKTKAILINTPNNPTGAMYSKDTLRQLGDLIVENKLFLIFDECYREITYSNHKHYNPVQSNKKLKDFTIIIDSFSKSCAITGWRIGYFCANKTIVKAINNFQSHTSSNACSISQYAVLTAYSQEQTNFIKQARSILEKRLQIACNILDSITGVVYTRPQGAFYIFLNVANKLGLSYDNNCINDVNQMTETMLEEIQVATVSGTAFNGGNCIRISFATSDRDIHEGLLRIKKFMEHLV